MKTYKEALVTNKVTEKIICNCCGIEIKNDDNNYLDNHITIEKKWGYGSSLDGETHSIDLCTSCYQKFLMHLKVPYKD